MKDGDPCHHNIYGFGGVRDSQGSRSVSDINKAKDKSQKFYKQHRNKGTLAISMCEDSGPRILTSEDRALLDELKAAYVPS